MVTSMVTVHKLLHGIRGLSWSATSSVAALPPHYPTRESARHHSRSFPSCDPQQLKVGFRPAPAAEHPSLGFNDCNRCYSLQDDGIYEHRPVPVEDSEIRQGFPFVAKTCENRPRLTFRKEQ